LQKEKRVVLTEEKYLAGLDEIMERDFFPDIKKLKAQTEYTEVRALPALSLRAGARSQRRGRHARPPNALQ